jgi:hypothetical protein
MAFAARGGARGLQKDPPPPRGAGTRVSRSLAPHLFECVWAYGAGEGGTAPCDQGMRPPSSGVTLLCDRARSQPG